MKRKLFLTSSGLPKAIREYFIPLLPKKPKEILVCFIPTAADPGEDKSFVDSDKREIKEIGMKIKEVDLKNETEKTLAEKLSNCDVVYVTGGNTFYLLEWVRKSGFDKVIHRLVNKGKIYVGASAGSYIACPTIEQAAWKHPNRNVVGLQDLTALNFIPFLITAHFEEKHRPSIEKAAKNTKYPIVCLNDKQAVLIKNEKVKIVGQGKKFFFNNFSEV